MVTLPVEGKAGGPGARPVSGSGAVMPLPVATCHACSARTLRMFHWPAVNRLSGPAWLYSGSFGPEPAGGVAGAVRVTATFAPLVVKTERYLSPAARVT